MDPTDSKSNGLERRLSTRNSVRVSVSGRDEDLDLLVGMVSDGFRPPDSAHGMDSLPPVATPPADPVPSSNIPEASQSSASDRRSSVSKPPRPQESFALRHDGGMGPIEESSSALTRTSSHSTESTAYIPPADSPYRGPSGPSHPYEMYPQNVRMGRTMSMTTTSTEPVSESSYAGPRAPTHPYNMYTQDATTGPVAVPSAPIPLGFHGHPGQYQRRVGAEGEEIDIIGPEGHTEQLPPYTRYPDEAYARKVRDVETLQAAAPIGGASIVPPVPPVQTSALPVIPGAGGIGLATRNPEFESADDLGSPRSRHSSRSFTSDGSEHEINLAAAGLSEKGRATSGTGEPVEGWRRWMRRRVGGVIPVWSILLTAVVLLLMGIILGSVIGAFMSKQKKSSRGSQEPSTSSTATMTFDAMPIPTPTDLAPLPLGAFSMPLMGISRVHRGCFNDTTMAQAWQCHLVISNLKLTIAKTKMDSLGDYTASITCNTSNTVTNNVFSYGEQPFLIEKPAPLELVTDTTEPNRGPAWFKLLTFNKTVIVPESAIKLDGKPEDNRRRIRNFGAKYTIGATDFKRKGLIPDGHKPWICTWPDTYLEMFIYVQQNSSLSAMRPPPPPPPSPPSTSSSTPGPPAKNEPTSGPKYSADPRNPEYTPHPAEAPKNPPPTPTLPTPANGAADPTASSSIYGPIDLDSFTPPPPPYPRVVKIEERHMYGPAKARCEQVEIQDVGLPPKPVIGPDGKPVVIEIIETERSSQEPLPMDMARRSSSPLLYRDTTSSPDSRNQCGCMWFMT